MVGRGVLQSPNLTTGGVVTSPVVLNPWLRGQTDGFGGGWSLFPVLTPHRLSFPSSARGGGLAGGRRGRALQGQRVPDVAEAVQEEHLGPQSTRRAAVDQPVHVHGLRRGGKWRRLMLRSNTTQNSMPRSCPQYG